MASNKLLSLYEEYQENGKKFYESWLRVKATANEEGIPEEKVNHQELEWETNNGNCVFTDCTRRATGWIYNISACSDRNQMLHACDKHVKLFRGEN